MRIPVAVFGVLVMFVAAVEVLFLGILGFTPVNACTGACYAPFMTATVGTVVIGGLNLVALSVAEQAL